MQLRPTKRVSQCSQTPPIGGRPKFLGEGKTYCTQLRITITGGATILKTGVENIKQCCERSEHFLVCIPICDILGYITRK